jgi:hypothetical protein
LKSSDLPEFLAERAADNNYSETAFCLMYAANDWSGPM